MALAALGVTIAVGMVRGATAPVEVVGGRPNASATRGALVATRSSEDGIVYVHVSGAVAHPGLYRVATDARLVDAIAASGGFSADADRDAVNLARPVVDGEQVHVPREGEEPAVSTAAGGGLLDLNAADEAALCELPGIGPALARRIIAWRQANGRFTSVDDLLAVSGIGQKLLAGLHDLVRV